MKSAQSKEVWRLLGRVSRSFHLTLRILPWPIRRQIGIAYLLARATDTIADTRLVPLEQRLAALGRMRDAIRAAAEASAAAPALAPLDGLAAAGETATAERRLLESTPRIIELLRNLSHQDRQRIRAVLEIITSGQEIDLLRFGSSGPDGIVSLCTEPELEDYTYRVAGCVGEFWTTMCRAHLFPGARLDDALLQARAIRFGKGLQLINILRDLPKDLRLGRCYLPSAQLANYGLRPADLLHPSAMDRLRPLYDAYIDCAHQHLKAGWEYTNTLPRNQVRLRLACAWPILIGARTLSLLRLGNVLDDSVRIKISRSEVYGLVLRSVVCYGRPAAWDRMIEDVGHG